MADNSENWIRMFCRASQNKEEFIELYKEVLKIEPQTIVEIGCHFGGSLEAWCGLFGNTKVIGIEKNDKIEIESNNLTVIHGDSHDTKTLTTLSNLIDSIDFLFIDGDHTYESVKKDFEMYSPLVRKGGLIVFHDAFIQDNPTVEVYKFWKEISPKYPHKLFHNPDGGTGTGILFV